MKRYLILFAITLSICALLFLLPGVKGLSINPFQQTSIKTKTLDGIETVKLSQFNSARYRYKSLFPYDFIYGEPNWGSILYKNQRFLTEEEKLNKDFYIKCNEIGIDINMNKHFFTITTLATAGLDLDKYLNNAIIFTNEDNGLIIVKKPITEIMTIEVVDSLKDEEYPQISITPGQWQQLITLLLPMIENDLITTGLLDSAEVESRNFLEKLFLSVGWSKVEFK